MTNDKDFETALGIKFFQEEKMLLEHFGPNHYIDGGNYIVKNEGQAGQNTVAICRLMADGKVKLQFVNDSFYVLETKIVSV